MPHEPDRFAIVPIYADSTGCEAVPQNAIAHGSMHAVMARIKDSRQMREDLRVSNQADQVRRAQAALRADAAELEAERAAFATDVEAVREVLLNEFVGKLDKLAARVDALEQERAHDPDDDELPLPPGTLTDEELEAAFGSNDDGELEASHPPSRDKHIEQLKATEHDAEGGVPLSYGKVPTSFVHAEDQGNELPPELERRTPASGTMPVYDPRDLAHPQKAQQQPIAIGGDDEDLPPPPVGSRGQLT